VSLFLPRDIGIVPAITYLLGMMLLINLPCIGVWALFGSSLRTVLQRRTARLAFNVSMAVALVATGVIMVT
jgi:threonine/homoserine/homoserine lactone efflux protein